MGNCCNSNTLVVGRPSQQSYNSACASGVKTGPVNGGGCGTSACNSPVAAHDRRLSPRKFREKVREDIRDYVLLMLGAPVVKIELDQQNLDLAVDQSLKVFEDYAGREYFDYYRFYTTPGKSVYKLPDDVGIVRNVYYKEQGTLPSQLSDLGGAVPVDYFYPGGTSNGMSGAMNPAVPTWGDAGGWTLYKQYENLYAQVSSNIGGWEWISDMGHVKLYPIPCRTMCVYVHYLQKCKDWKEVTQAMQEGALAHAMIMLGHIRGKYASPPGPGGGMQLDGEYMKTKGWELKEKWQEDLIYRFGDMFGPTMD